MYMLHNSVWLPEDTETYPHATMNSWKALCRD